jgi:cytoskeletal protein RodZ
VGITKLKSKKTVTLTSPLPAKQEANSVGFKRFRNKTFLALAAVLVIAIIIIALFIPQGEAAIPLNANFNVGEKLTYNDLYTENVTLSSLAAQGGNSTQLSSTREQQEVLEVISFDGDSYTFNHTTTLSGISVSVIEKMNKTGYSVNLVNAGNNVQEAPNNNPANNPYIAQLLTQLEVKVGDNITIPFPSSTSNTTANVTKTGNMTITFKGIQDLTVPAGTYRVVRVDMTSNDVSMTVTNALSQPANESAMETMTLKMQLSYQIYIEYGTMKLIQETMQSNNDMQLGSLHQIANCTFSMVLNQDI